MEHLLNTSWKGRLLNAMRSVPMLDGDERAETVYWNSMEFCRDVLKQDLRLPFDPSTAVRKYDPFDLSTDCRTVFEHKWQILGDEKDVRLTMFNWIYLHMIQGGASHGVAMARAVYLLTFATFRRNSNEQTGVVWTDIVWVEDLS